MNHSPEQPSPLSRTDILIAILIGIAALALYIRTLAPSLLWGDSAEFQTISYALGMTPPSGYMTQVLFNLPAAETAPAPMTLVLNWFSGLRK